MLSNFFLMRPTKNELVSKNIIHDEEYGPKLDENILQIIITYLKNNKADQEEGIFRIPGIATNARRIHKSFESTPVFVDTDINDVAEAFKAYLREAPEQLIPINTADALITAIEQDSPLDSKIKTVQQILLTINPDNRRMINTVLNFLTSISSNSEVTKMNSVNLGLIFGPTMCKIKETSTLDLNAGVSKRSALITFLLTHLELIYKDLDLTCKPVLDLKLNLSSTNIDNSDIAGMDKLPTAEKRARMKDYIKILSDEHQELKGMSSVEKLLCLKQFAELYNSSKIEVKQELKGLGSDNLCRILETILNFMEL